MNINNERDNFTVLHNHINRNGSVIYHRGTAKKKSFMIVIKIVNSMPLQDARALLH